LGSVRGYIVEREEQQQRAPDAGEPKPATCSEPDVYGL